MTVSDDLADLEEALEEWEARMNVVPYDPSLVPGALGLCDEGCGLLVWLVVTGPERGRMWRDPRCDSEDLYPLSSTDGHPLTFAAWYLGWLASAEAALA